MFEKSPRTPWLASALALTLTPSLFADSVSIGGPHRPGHARPPLHLNLTPAAAVSYTPAQIRHAYGFDQVAATGAGQKIAIVDAYGNASIQNDLDMFCTQFGLSSTTVQILGNNTSSDASWAMETALDVEWAHVVAPGATIILSVARSSSVADLLAAVDAAVNAGATVVSMSWGGPEFAGMSTYDSHFNTPNVTFTASSGDNGAGLEWPAVSPYVLGVGGTSLYLDASYNRTSETAWAGSGGGTSISYSQPAYQNGWQTSGRRGVPDASYLADPNTGVQIYDAVNGGWFVVGGTSAGAPQWAGLIALVNQLRAGVGAAPLGTANSTIYSLAQGSPATPYAVNSTYFYDVSQGNNGLYDAGPPYDFVTGLGSPLGGALVPALDPAPGPAFSISATPATQSFAPGSSGTASYTVTVTSLQGFAGTVNLSATVQPLVAGATVNPPSISLTSGSSGSSALAVPIPGTAGTYTIIVTGQAGGITHTATLMLLVQQPVTSDFSLAVSPSSRNIKAGKYTSYSITISCVGGFSDSVYVTVSGLPPGASYTKTEIGGGATTSAIAVMAAPGSAGSYTLTVTGSSNGVSGIRSHSANVSVVVR